MNIEWLRPSSFLLLLVAVPLLWWSWRYSLSALEGWRRKGALAVRGVVLLLVIVALAEPRWNGTTRQEQVLLLVDQSLSLGDRALVAAEEFLKIADFAGAETGWIGFAERGRTAETLKALQDADPQSLNPRQTRLDTAVSLATASFKPGRVRTAVLFTDGVATGPEPSAEALAAQGIRLHVVPVTPPDRPEALVRSVTAPGRVRAEEPLAIEATIQSTRAGEAEVDLFRNGVRIATRKLELAVGSNPIRFEDRAGDEKLLHYEVGVRAKEDTLSENNLAGTAVISEGKARVLLVSDRPESARYLEWALRQEGISLSVRPARGAPTAMSDLQNFDALILDNVPAADLSLEQMEMFRNYTRDFGGGLLMLGGDQAYGLGGYYRTPVEELLPVQCDFEKEEESPSLALALVIDRSGSMQGEKIEMAKAAASASAGLLGVRDFISVIAFDHESYLIVPMQQAGSMGEISGRIASIEAGGGTNIAPGMEDALRQLSSVTAKLKHVILMTDGQSSPGPYQELTMQMVNSQITVSAVAMGQGADSALLAQIAQWGNGRFYEVSEAQSLPQIFTRETMTASKSAIQEFPFLAKPLRAVDFLEGIDWQGAPFLLGYVRTRPKPTSETWLVTERGDPLLTTWRFGLGTTAAFTSDTRNRWAGEWLRWQGFGKFWGQLLRRISRPAALGLSEVEIREQGEALSVTVDALDPAGAFPREVTGFLRLSSPKGKLHTLPLEKLQPGRWEAIFPASEEGIYSGQVQLQQGDTLFDSRFFTFTKGFSPEYFLEPLQREKLEALALATGGEMAPAPATVFTRHDRIAPREHELWPWFSFAALVLFLVDVAIRRWPES